MFVHDGVWMQRIVSALVVIVVGGLLTVTAFLMVKNWEKEAVESALIRNSIVGAYSLKIQMEQHLLLTRSLEGLFASSEHVSREEFNRFGDALLDNTDNVIGVGWLPRVSLAERETYERELGEIVGGQKGIWERNASGEPSNAGVREEYFPLYFATPFDVSKKVFGFDFLSSPTAVEAMTLARDTGELTVTDEIRPAIGGRQQSRILTFMPYYENGVFPQDLDDRRKGLQGFVIGSHQIDNIMDSSLSASGGEGVNYYLYDGTLPDRRKFLYAYGRGNNHAPVAMADLLRSGGHHVVPIEVGNRKWDLVAEATPEFVAIKSSWRPSIALLIGTLFTLLLAAFIDKITTSSLRAKLLATQEGKVRQQAETALAEQHHTELALRESERKFRMIFNNSYELIGLLGLDGTLLDANDTSLEFAGCSKSEVLNRPFWETAWWSHSPELQEQLRTAIDQAATGKMVKFETTHPAENGREYTVDFSISPLFDEQGQVVLLIPEGRDITERKEMEQKLQSSENDLRMLIDQSPIGLTLCTLDGNIVQANPAYARITGYSSDEILQLSIGEITPKKYTDQEQHKIDQLLTTGRFGPYEKEYRHKAGHLVPGRVNGRLI